MDSPCFDKAIRAKAVKAAYIKISKNCICKDQILFDGYRKNVGKSKAKSYIKSLPNALAFLTGALDLKPKTLSAWLGANGFDYKNSEEEKAILFIRLVLTDFFANYMKPPLMNTFNKRNPFAEYLIPVFKYYSAVY